MRRSGRRCEYDAAIRENQRVLELAPPPETQALAHFYLGSFYERKNDPDRALEHYRRALEENGELVEGHFYLAEFLARSDRLTEALPHYARVGEIEPSHGIARLREAEVLMRLGRFPEAKRVLEDAVATSPRDPTLAHALGRLLAGAPDASLRNGPRGLALAERLLETASTPPHIETLAMALAEAGQFEEATRAQSTVLAEAKRLNRKFDAERLERNLARYENQTACCATPSDAFPVVLPNSPFANRR